MYRAGILLGADHTELGEVRILEVAPDLVIGITRGRFPKGYPHKEPNEDAVFAGTDGASSVLAVADGHNGTWASHTAIQAIATATEQSIGDPDLLDLLLDAAKAAVTSNQDGSETALAVMATTPGRVEVAQFGDTAFIHSDQDQTEVRVGTAPFLRRGDRADRLAIDSLSGIHGLATDGVTSFVPPSSETYKQQRGETATAYARRIVDQALQGGAGDNVAIAVQG